jgi:multimeric flavodoxin WrbA
VLHHGCDLNPEVSVKVLAICATAKPKGPSVNVLWEAMEVVEAAGHQTEIALLPKLNITFCNHCAECDHVETCTIDDDLWPLYLKMKAADAIILSTPLAFGSAMAMLKAVMERAGRISRLNGRQFADKRAALLILEFGEGLELTRQQLEIWCRLVGMRTPIYASINFQGKHSRESIDAGAAARSLAAVDFGKAIVQMLDAD